MSTPESSLGARSPRVTPDLPGRHPGLDLRCSRPTSKSVVIRAGGELDCRTAARLHELLATRLSSMVDTVVLDLSGLSFIGVAGLELLLHAHRQASSRRVDLRLVTGDAHCLRRALIAAESTETFHCYVTLELALATVPGRRRDQHATG
ncbi:anti-anti-sigma factor [Saccharopolyspora antimicrobica]|uniref:Anti-anti-sigma factor n=1 Tax=Saccharopolyspora antimicrobica TaxID=455193 RepID=A0A1I4VVY9_9PSEU|nr:STAS domain-containing protein [Saccharopolyspora antimicrobica]RKT87186.1 anti-anti-sigma factor [Saccharopolyspora antimicrobica]SFN05342.1 anti-anti-sigma factor [Saccharopolyspora antimicrobica]